MKTELPAALVEAIRGASRSGEIAIAYSGGLDSRFLAFCAKEIGLSPLLYHVKGPHVAPAETESAIERAREMGVRLRGNSLFFRLFFDICAAPLRMTQWVWRSVRCNPFVAMLL